MRTVSRLIYDQAHALQEAGYSLVALAPGGKRPMMPGWQAIRSTKRLLAEWFSFCPDMNVGIHCGFSRISVLDCDTPQAADWVAENFPKTEWWQESPSNGRHYPFFDPEGAVPIKVNLMNIGLDTRSRCSQIVASPSYSQERRRRWVRHGTLVRPEDLPVIPTDWLADADRATPIQPCPKPKEHFADVSKMVEPPDMRRVFAYLDACPRSVSSQSGHTVCFRSLTNCLRAFPWLALDRFREAALYYDATKCDPPFGPGKGGIDHKIEDCWRKVRGS